MIHKKMDLITGLLREAEHYSTLNQLEKLVEEGSDLSNMPVQPLYMITRSMTNEALAQYLGNFSREQRQSFLDIDLWQRDNIDVDNFSRWIKVYDHCPQDEIIQEFIKSEEFLLFLKSRFNIYTFDVEDPLYPDHDNYFLTEDNLLLIEFDENNELVFETQNLIKRLYAFEGAEYAYTLLFKMVSEPFSSFQEEEYQHKKNRMEDFGFVDYYDSLSIYSPFPSIDVMNNYIKKGEKLTGNIDVVGLMQSLHLTSLVAYKDVDNDVEKNLLKVKEEKRKNFLQFNFMKLINGSITFNDCLKSGQVAMTRVGRETKSILELGFDYVKATRRLDDDESIFDYFNFIDLFRIGNTLIKTIQKEMQKTIRDCELSGDNQYFVGEYWNNFLDVTIKDQIFISKNGKSELINKYTDFKILEKKVDTFVTLLPYMMEFYKMYRGLEEEGLLNDSFYLNYKTTEIDFEAIILSSFANYMLGHRSAQNSPKMGLTVREFKKWISMFIDSDNKIQKKNQDLLKAFKGFQNEYGLKGVKHFIPYIQEIISLNLEGCEFNKLQEDEFKHIGGVILLTL